MMLSMFTGATLAGGSLIVGLFRVQVERSVIRDRVEGIGSLTKDIYIIIGKYMSEYMSGLEVRCARSKSSMCVIKEDGQCKIEVHGKYTLLVIT